YDYLDSALNAEGTDDAAFGAGPRVGAPLRNARLDGPEERYLLDLLRPAFTGLYFCSAEALPERVSRLLRRLADGDLPFAGLVVSTRPLQEEGIANIVDPSRRVFRAYGAQDGTFYLARPDAHVCARWLHVDTAAVPAALATAAGRAAPPGGCPA